MVKIDIFSGFLGAGKTTLIKKLIKEAYAGEKLVLVENEFGEIGVDGAFMKEAGITVNELNSGCICCSLVGDFSVALKKVITEYAPDRILIDPSGVGKLSEVITAVQSVEGEDILLNTFTTVVDATKPKMYMKNFGEFFNNQVEHANCIVFSHTGKASEKKLTEALTLVREKNPTATVIVTPWEELDGKEILAAMEHKDTLEKMLEQLKEEHEHHHHEHHHEHDEECDCGCHGHHHHHADEVFTSWGVETAKKFILEELQACLEELCDEGKYGVVLRAKGVVCAEDGGFFHFDYVPGEEDLRRGGAVAVGMLCVIGAGIKEEELKALFGV